MQVRTRSSLPEQMIPGKMGWKATLNTLAAAGFLHKICQEGSHAQCKEVNSEDAFQVKTCQNPKHTPEIWNTKVPPKNQKNICHFPSFSRFLPPWEYQSQSSLGAAFWYILFREVDIKWLVGQTGSSSCCATNHVNHENQKEVWFWKKETWLLKHLNPPGLIHDDACLKIVHCRLQTAHWICQGLSQGLFSRACLCLLLFATCKICKCLWLDCTSCTELLGVP